MKKLIPMVAAVAGTLSAFAGGLNTTMTFDEGFALGDTITGQTTDADGNVYWKVNEDAETGTIANEAPYSADSGMYLAVDTADAFYRHANAVGGSGVDIAEAKGVFVDTMLKFTLSEESDQTLDKDAQFGLWLAAPEENGPTNIWIKMGSVNEAGTITPTNIAIGVANAIDPNAWHRVTIRSIANINQDMIPLVGYVVFIDGNETPLAYQGDDYAALIDPAVVKDAAAKGYYEKKQLFVGLVNAAQLTAVGFKGMGSTDDIMISDFENAPLFAKGKVEFKVMWNPDAIASIVINGNAEDNDGECIVALTDSTKVTVEATAAEGYEVAEKIEWTWAADFVEAEIPVKKINFTAGGNNYASLTAAIEAGETSIAVVANTAETVANMIAISSGNVVIDLNGKTFTVTGEDYSIFDVEGGALTVIDSVGGGALVANSEVEGFGVFYGTDITIGAAEGDEGATFIGNLAYEGTEMVINKGLFDKASNTTADAFTYADAKADGTEVTEAGDYWKVDVKGEPEKDFIIQIAGTGAKYETFAEALEAANDGDTLTLLKDVTGDGVKIEKSITVDFNGFTYTVGAGLVGSPSTQSQAFNLVRGKTITLKNGTITSTVARMLVQNYANLTLDSMTLDGSGLAAKNGKDNDYVAYTLSNCAGETVITGDTVIKARVLEDQKSFAFDTWYKAGVYEDAAVTVDGATITGDIELTGGSLTFTAGTLTGALVAGSNIEKGVVTKGKDLVLTAPEGYEWKDGTTLVEKSDEPTIPEEEGTIEKDEEGNYVVTPVEGTNTVDITELPAGATVIVPGSIDKINGLTEGATVIVKNDGHDITAACTITDGAIVLNETAVVDGVPVKPTIAEAVMVGDDEVAPFDGVGTVAVKAIPGLKYQLVAGDEVGAVTTAASEVTIATGDGVKLENTKFTATGAKAFFKVVVTK